MIIMKTNLKSLAFFALRLAHKLYFWNIIF